ncbi:MAG: RNA 2',3'-cyclic phosphodiesterase [Gammaproteobacteria bacterium]|jgi:2'-5' RNA ligase
MRLFVALDLPAPIAAALASVTIPPGPGVRRVPPGQMHMTLHFIGDADPDVICRALAPMKAGPCGVTVRGAGRFKLAGGRKILWARVTETPGLRELHAACGRALARTGFEVERRRFVPHVTLARLSSSADASIVSSFLSACADRDFGAFVADRFVLYDSVAQDDRMRYQPIETFVLQ